MNKEKGRNAYKWTDEVKWIGWSVDIYVQKKDEKKNDKHM